MDLQLQEGPRFGIIPGHPQLPGNGILKRMMEEEPAKTTETDAELPSENMEKSKMTEEEMNKYCRDREPGPEDRSTEDRGEAGRYRAQHRSQQGDDR
eukprot:3503467-Heterocapsa_arctica.AAC.1